jgi:replicative DNA helicase
MVTETFLNSCFTLLLNQKTKVRKNNTMYRDVLEILSFYQDKKDMEIPIVLRNKVDCLKKICEMKLEGKNDENVIDSISLSEKYKPMIDFLNIKMNEDVKDQVLLDNVKQISLRKKVNSLFSNYDQLSKFVSTVKDGTFESIDDIVGDHESIVKTLYSNLMKQGRSISIEASSSLDFRKDSFMSVVETIRKHYDRSNVTPTGFPILDNNILNGGFEPSRIYVIGGGSSAGKSTLINNVIIKSATMDPSIFFGNKRKNLENRVYIYITLENTIEEALLRTYQPLFSKTTQDVLFEISSLGSEEFSRKMKKEIVEELDKTKSNLIMKYFVSKTISTTDIMMVVDDVINEYGKESIMGLYVDYLDLLRTDVKYELYRIELGDITMSLKCLAVAYEIPVIVATQLGRSVYKTPDSFSLNLDQMGESIKKVEHADFVALMAQDLHDETIVHMKIGKNRGGKKNVALDFKVQFDMYKFLQGTMSSSEQKDPTTETGGFSGFGPNGVL